MRGGGETKNEGGRTYQVHKNAAVEFEGRRGKKSGEEKGEEEEGGEGEGEGERVVVVVVVVMKVEGCGGSACLTFLNLRFVFLSKNRTHSSALPLLSFQPWTRTPTVGPVGPAFLVDVPALDRLFMGSFLPEVLVRVTPLPLAPTFPRSAAGPLGALFMLMGRVPARRPPRPPRPLPRPPAGASMSKSPSRSTRARPPPPVLLVIPPLLTREERAADMVRCFGVWRARFGIEDPERLSCS